MISLKIKPKCIIYTEEDDPYYAETNDSIITLNIPECANLTNDARAYLLLHEYIHTITSGQHDKVFYNTLHEVLTNYGWSNWPVAREMEQIYPNWMEL